MWLAICVVDGLSKTFSMFFAALLGVTLVPVLMLMFVRGKIKAEAKNPVNRFLIWAYHPVVHFVLRFRWLTLLAALIIVGITIYPFQRLGKEFMPPLNEGDLLFMPTAVPGIAIGEATRILQIQDRLLRQFPEVDQACFFSDEQARRKLKPTQVPFLDRLRAALG